MKIHRRKLWLKRIIFQAVRVLEFIKIRVLKYDPNWERYKNIKIGKHTYGFTKDNIYMYLDTDEISIGSYCSIAAEVKFVLSGEHYYERVSTYPLSANLMYSGPDKDTKSKGRIEVGNDVWIGFGATVLSGVKIGDGSVIAANSLVTKDVEPYSIVAGVPAKKIKERFPSDIAIRMKELNWWNWSEDTIKDRIEDFYRLTPKQFIEKHEV